MAVAERQRFSGGNPHPLRGFEPSAVVAVGRQRPVRGDTRPAGQIGQTAVVAVGRQQPERPHPRRLRLHDRFGGVVFARQHADRLRPRRVGGPGFRSDGGRGDAAGQRGRFGGGGGGSRIRPAPVAAVRQQPDRRPARPSAHRPGRTERALEPHLAGRGARRPRRPGRMPPGGGVERLAGQRYRKRHGGCGVGHRRPGRIRGKRPGPVDAQRGSGRLCGAAVRSERNPPARPAGCGHGGYGDGGGERGRGLLRGRLHGGGGFHDHHPGGQNQRHGPVQPCRLGRRRSRGRVGDGDDRRGAGRNGGHRGDGGHRGRRYGSHQAHFDRRRRQSNRRERDHPGDGDRRFPGRFGGGGTGPDGSGVGRGGGGHGFGRDRLPAGGRPAGNHFGRAAERDGRVRLGGGRRQPGGRLRVAERGRDARRLLRRRNFHRRLRRRRRARIYCFAGQPGQDGGKGGGGQSYGDGVLPRRVGVDDFGYGGDRVGGRGQ